MKNPIVELAANRRTELHETRDFIGRKVVSLNRQLDAACAELKAAEDEIKFIDCWLVDNVLPTP